MTQLLSKSLLSLPDSHRPASVLLSTRGTIEKGPEQTTTSTQWHVLAR